METIPTKSKKIKKLKAERLESAIKEDILWDFRESSINEFKKK